MRYTRFTFVGLARTQRSVHSGILAGVLALLTLGSACVVAGPRYRYRPRLTTPGSDLLAALMVASGNETVAGNSAKILENGDGAFPAMLEDIRAAKSSIHLETFIFRDGQIGSAFVAALGERARAGVSVRLLLDAWGSLRFGSENARILQEAGAQVVFFRPLLRTSLFKVHLRTHRKVLIIDGRIGFTGGICIDDSWLGNADQPHHWRETQVRIEGPVVRQMQTAFARAWIESTGELLSGKPLYPDGGPAGTLTCQVMDSTPAVITNPARLSFLIATSAATKTIDITNAYFVPDRATRRALIEAARRGVRVRLILPSRNTDVKAVRHAGRIYYKSLMEAGVQIFEYAPSRLHAKTMVVDGAWSSIGSTNLNRRSFYWNYESNMNVFDPGFASEMEAMFDRDLARSERVDPLTWKKRPLSDRFAERLYGLLRWQY